MAFTRISREEEEYRRFRYPDTDVLINQLDIRDAAELDAVERTLLVRERADSGFPTAAQQLTYAGFKAIHQHLFQDVYDWAGTVRTYTTGRGSAPLAVPEFIDQSMDAQFAKLERWSGLRNASSADFAWGAAELVNELNAVHPFIEGNGRTQRAWLRLLGAQAGYKITLRSDDRAAWYDSSRIGFEEQDHRPMERLVASRLEDHSIPNGASDDVGL